jgi:hypothetical protein
MTPEELVRRRKALGHTQESVASVFGVSERQVQNWEAGHGKKIPAYVGLMLDWIEHQRTCRTTEQRYRWLLDRALPTFSEAEALAICDALNGVIWPDLIAVPLVGENVRAATGLDVRHGVDQDALADRIGALAPVGQLAVIDAAERFWSAVAAGQDTDAALAASGLVASDEPD